MEDNTEILNESEVGEYLHFRHLENVTLTFDQWCGSGSGSGRICIHLGSWIRIQRGEFNQQKFWGFFVRNYIFQIWTLKGSLYLQIGTNLKMNFFSPRLKDGLGILLAWIRIRIHQILWIRIRIQSMRILITRMNVSYLKCIILVQSKV